MHVPKEVFDPGTVRQAHMNGRLFGMTPVSSEWR